MGRFRDSSSHEMPAISTASLPDIIFMLLFFFMISTSMKEGTIGLVFVLLKQQN